MNDIIMPGELVSGKSLRMEHTFVDSGKTYSSVIGVYGGKSGKSIVPLEGAWKARCGDIVVGIVKSVRNKVYIIDLSFFGKSLLIASRYDRHVFEEGEIVEAVIKDIEGRRTMILEEPRFLEGGTIINIKPMKIPRVIGRSSTMIRQISEATKTKIVVGMNGIIWLKGGDVALAIEAILRIQNEAHVAGLTDRIRLMLEERNETNDVDKVI